jgi:peptidoglycan/LPS O-acetylase OafA/YrhL
MGRLATWIARSPLGLYALAAPTVVCLWFMNGWGMDTPDQSLIPHVPVLLVYTLCFGFGWWLFRGDALMQRFARLTRARWLVCVISISLCVYLSTFQAQSGQPNIEAIRGAFVVSYAIMMWTLVALTIGLFKHFLDRPSPVVRYVADASYWLYLVHLPIVLWLQIAVAELPLHWSLKWALISGVTIAGCLLLYDALVRSTLIGRILNGRRKARVLFSRKVRRVEASI